MRLTCLPGAHGAARADEVKEVVVNLLENARNAGARVVDVTVGPGRIEVADDGSRDSAGAAAADLRAALLDHDQRLGARAWRSSGGWSRGGAGEIAVESGVGRGTRVVVQLPA